MNMNDGLSEKQSSLLRRDSGDHLFYRHNFAIGETTPSKNKVLSQSHRALQ